jgi:uncharacterized protein YndB with AHSA1/START domain
MMATYERTVDSTASPEQVWALWSDPEHWPDWNPDVSALSLDGPFAQGVTGAMTSGGGRTHRVKFTELTVGHSFMLETSPIPATRFRFECRVDAAANGSRVTQAVSMSGLLAPIMGPMAGDKIAEGFLPILRALAARAEGRPA